MRDLICVKCGKQFCATFKRGHCFICIPKKEVIAARHIKNSTEYSDRRSFELGARASYFWCLKHRRDIIDNMPTTKIRWDETYFWEFVGQCETFNDFNRLSNARKWANKLGVLDKVKKMLPGKKLWLSEDECRQICDKYTTFREFVKREKKLYAFMVRNKYNQYFSIFKDYYCKGYSYTDFKAGCSGNNDIGLFYILKCFDQKEMFYKIGITSYSVDERYPSKSHMPYSYDIDLEFYKNSKAIFELEVYVKKYLKVFQYVPELKFSGETECFTSLHDLKSLSLF